MTMHTLKVDYHLFDDLKANIKRFEVRLDDGRNYRVGDVLKLCAWHDGLKEFTAQGHVLRKVLFVLHDQPRYGLQPGHVCMSIRPLTFFERIELRQHL